MAILKRISFTDGFSSEVTPSETIVGAPGFLVGEGVPSDIDDGKDTDYYMDSTTGSIYLKTDGEWALYTALETTPALAAHLSDVTDAHDASAISSVAAGNLAATDVQSALNELQTDIDTRALSSALSSHESDTSTHGVTTVAGISETQILTNKDIDGGTASNTSRITLPKADKAVLDALTRKEGTIVYDSTGNKAYVDNGSLLVEVGSGSGGAFNYISNSDAEADASGWTRYANTSASAKPDNFGGSANGSTTWTRSTSTPLNGDACFLLTKDAANRQGEGVYYEFTAEEGHKTLKLLLSMLADTSNANITDSDLAIYLVGSDDDFVADFLVIEPNNPAILAGVPQIFKQLQLNADKTKYRLCIHISSTNATAYTAKFDDVVFGPSSVATGAMVSDWISYTPTSSWVSNTTVTGKYQRVGDSINLQVKHTLTGAPTSATLTFDLPSGLTFDTAKMESSSTGADDFGRCYILDASGATYTGILTYEDTNSIRVLYITTSTAEATVGSVAATVPFTFATGDTIISHIRGLPIAGWSSNTASSEDLGNRDIRVFARNNNGATITAGSTAFNWNDVVTDTTGSWAGGADEERFTAPETGRYNFFGSIRITAASTSEIRAYKNGSNFQFVSGFEGQATKSFSYSVDLNKGDYIDFRPDIAVTLNPNSADHWIMITKDNSAKTILETETVAARYTSNSGATISAGSFGIIDFEDKEFDTHSAVTTGASWKFTAPYSGTYLVASSMVIQTTQTAAAENIQFFLYKNGSAHSELYFLRFQYAEAITRSFGFAGSTLIELSKGDYIDLRMNEGITGTATVTTTSTLNHVSINRIK